MKTNHSPLPWTDEQWPNKDVFGTDMRTISSGSAYVGTAAAADAALIVRAVNAHAELVAALENLITACTHADPAGQEATANRVAAKRIARAALARAKGE